MINANELRIGNLVALKDGYFVPIADGGILAINQKRFECYPISLTPEILEKCGFVMHKTSQLWRKDNFYLHHYLVSDNEYCFKYSDFTSSSIQYLHQLQNLYFALCGEELNYTP